MTAQAWRHTPARPRTDGRVRGNAAKGHGCGNWKLIARVDVVSFKRCRQAQSSSRSWPSDRCGCWKRGMVRKVDGRPPIYGLGVHKRYISYTNNCIRSEERRVG